MVLILWIVGPIPHGAAQNLPSVDVETANLQIEQFEQENQSLESQLELLAESVLRLETEIETWTAWVRGIEKVAEALSEQADQLLEVLSEIGSRSIVVRAETVLARYDRISQMLMEKQRELSERIAKAETIVASNRESIALYEQRIEQNERNIGLLKAAIAKSQSSESLIETYLEGLDRILDEAAELLEQPASEAD